MMPAMPAMGLSHARRSMRRPRGGHRGRGGGQLRRRVAPGVLGAGVGVICHLRAAAETASAAERLASATSAAIHAGARARGRRESVRFMILLGTTSR